jgi:3-methyladenine DNA glycosylase AlkD
MASKIEHSAPRLKSALRELADPARRESQRRFFREPVRCLGVQTPDVRRLASAAAREYRRRNLPIEAVLAIADRLWRGGVLEERALAVVILGRFSRRLERRHWRRFEGWVSGLSNWAETDALCGEVLAPILARERALVARLGVWTRSRSRWRRRAAAVALVPLARRGAEHAAAFRVCDRLAADRDDMVEKAIGWLLKEVSRTRPQDVCDYLLANLPRLSRTTVRYACEKLPPRLRARVMAA